MKKGQMVASRLPEDMVRDLELIEVQEQSDRSTVIRRLLKQAIAAWKRDTYARRYGEGEMTLARAAEEADTSLWEMMEYVRQRKIASQYDLDDLQHDLALIEVAEPPRSYGDLPTC